MDKILKMFFSRTTGPISTKLGTKHPWGKLIQVCSNEGQPLLQGEIKIKHQKYTDKELGPRTTGDQKSLPGELKSKIKNAKYGTC